MKKKSSILYLVIFALVSIASVLILQHAKSPTLTPNKKVLSAFATNATYLSYNQLGQISTKISATHVTHYKGEQKTFFNQPYVVTYTKKRTPWHISAKHAVSNNSTNQILLSGNVVIRQFLHSKEPATTIKTEALTIFPQKSQATTPDNLVIYRHSSTIHGKGLIANLKSGQYELLSHSEGIYQP